MVGPNDKITKIAHHYGGSWRRYFSPITKNNSLLWWMAMRKLQQAGLPRLKNGDFFDRGVGNQKGFFKKKGFRNLLFLKKPFWLPTPLSKKSPFFNLGRPACCNFLIAIHHSNELFLVIDEKYRRQDPP